MKSTTTNKNDFKKVVRLQRTDVFKEVMVRAIKADSFKVVWEALDQFENVSIRLWVSECSGWP